MSTASTTMLGYIGRKPGTPIRPSDCWRTPQPYIDSARLVMGSIDLDPFSSPEANTAVKAKYFFTGDHSGLSCRWCPPTRRRRYPDGLNVWMNPPYSAQLIGQVSTAFHNAWQQGDMRQAIVLVNNATETRWFHMLRTLASAMCFPTGRIAFVDAVGQAIAGNTRGQVFLYMGTERTAFCQEFAQYGWVIDQERGWCA